MQVYASLTDVSVQWPSFLEVFHVLSFQAGYNTSVVVFGALLLGVAAGTIGCFAVLRNRALIGDALAHSALPGIAAAFLVANFYGFNAKSTVLLLLGASITGLLGVLSVQLLSSQTRLEEDASIGIVLSVFFGVGVTLLSIIQSLPGAQAAGLSKFIYGQTAAMQYKDAVLLASMAALVVVITLLLNKEFKLLCFDPEFARSLGWSTTFLDVLLLVALSIVTITGLQSVGILLVIALLVIPATAARFWTEDLSTMIVIGAIFGGLSGYLGASASALLPRLPAGAVIVLVAGLLFVVSMFLAPKRGVVAGSIRRVRLRHRIGVDHILRELFEIYELEGLKPSSDVLINRVSRSYGRGGVLGVLTGLQLALLSRAGDIVLKKAYIGLTDQGWNKASVLVRNHRLWEEYITTTANVDISHVDYSADLVEHVLSKEIVEMLELRLKASGKLPAKSLQSIHPISMEVVRE